LATKDPKKKKKHAPTSGNKRDKKKIERNTQSPWEPVSVTNKKKQRENMTPIPHHDKKNHAVTKKNHHHDHVPITKQNPRKGEAQKPSPKKKREGETTKPLPDKKSRGLAKPERTTCREGRSAHKEKKGKNPRPIPTASSKRAKRLRGEKQGFRDQTKKKHKEEENRSRRERTTTIFCQKSPTYHWLFPSRREKAGGRWMKGSAMPREKLSLVKMDIRKGKKNRGRSPGAKAWGEKKRRKGTSLLHGQSEKCQIHVSEGGNRRGKGEQH